MQMEKNANAATCSAQGVDPAIDRAIEHTQRAKRLAEAKVFVEENLDNSELSTSSIARHLNVSDRYIQLMFAEIEVSPTRFIRDMRLERVALLLRLSNQMITRVAFQIGFGDYSQFCRDFKQRFGMSPSCYRRISRCQ